MNQVLDYQSLLRRASYASFLLSTLLICIKLYASVVTHSLSMQASLIDSIVDSFASLINVIAIHHALRPADNEHRFGHGKIEALAAQGQSVFVAITALWIMAKAVNRLYHPELIVETTLGLFVTFFTIISTLVLYIYQCSVIRKTNSTIIKADSLHYKGDLFLNISVMIAFLFTAHGALIDCLCGFGIGLYILYMSWSIARESFDVLLDRELPETDKSKIIATLKAYPKIIGFHDLKTRSSGQRKFIQFHIELNDTISLREAHTISSELQDILEKQFSNVEIIIHEDPFEEKHNREPFDQI